MNMKAKTSLIFLALFLVVCGVQETFAGGFMIPHQTARGMSLSSAMTAGVTDASAVYYNPAALSEVEGNRLLISGFYINTINSVENNGRKAVNKHDDNFLATAFGNYHIPGTDFTLGMGAYTPFGLATTYEADFTRFAAERTQLKTIFVTPAVSWHPSKYFSVGTGLSFVHASGVLSRGLCLDPFTGCVTPGGPLEGRLRLTDTTNAFAYNIGLLFKPSANLKFGFSYRSRVDLRFDNADVTFGSSFSPQKVKADVRPLPLPPVINAGLFWQITSFWGMELVYEYTRWSEFKALRATFSPSPIFLPFGVPLSSFTILQDWKNTSALRFGSYYRINDNLELRGGFGLEETPIPAKTLSPAIPGADALSLNAGIGYIWENVSVDIGYVAVFYKTRTVSNSELEGTQATGIPFAGVPGKDRYETFNNLVSLTLTYRF